jgi:hypothetical protein
MLDARGKVSELRQFHGHAAGGDYDSTKYTYTPDDRLETVTDRKTATRWVDDRTGAGELGVRHARQGSSDVLHADHRRQQLCVGDHRVRLDGPTHRDAGRDPGLRRQARWDVHQHRAVQDGSVKRVKLPTTPGLPDETVELFYDANGNLDAMAGWQAYVSGTTCGEYGDPLQYHVRQQTGKTAFQSCEYEQGTRRLAKMKVDREGVLPTDDTFLYGYDDASNVTSISHQFGTSVDLQCFATDYLQRTTEAWTPAGECTDARSASTMGGVAPYWQSYSYDAAGNRTALVDHKAAGDTTSTYAYPAPTAARPHAVTGVSAAGPSGTSADTYAYDRAAQSVRGAPGSDDSEATLRT